MKLQPIKISGKKYLIRTCTSDKIIASSIRKVGHIVGVKDDERTIITLIEPDGIIPFTTVEMSKVLASLSFKEPYLDEGTQFGKKALLIGDVVTPKKSAEEKRISVKKEQIKAQEEPELDLAFTARLMAYYRAQENKRKHPLIIDPFAERLAGDLNSYLNKHIRISELHYPIVRSYYIEENLLTPWCNTHIKSQIILLGAGFDTRAYRFKPLQTNTHIIFEIDFPNVIHYKEKVLRNQKPLCKLVRLSSDLYNLDWTSHLKKSGFSCETPTFWVLEGLVYYIEKDLVASVLEKAAEMSTEDSQIFVDIMQLSRWFSFPYTSNGIVSDPFSRHIKWGLDINDVPSFFARVGWNVSCSFADKYDQGRDVGQKGMIFIHGMRASTI